MANLTLTEDFFSGDSREEGSLSYFAGHVARFIAPATKVCSLDKK